MRVITLNVNGIRSAANKGLFRWLAAQRADVVCLQEIKCQELDLDARLHGLKSFSSCYAFAQKKGYSGVALLSRTAPDEVARGFASREFDAEGRYVEARFGKLWVISVYLPSGSAGAHRQASKFRFLKQFLVHLRKLQERGHDFILCGDWNIAHQEIDLRNWKSQPEELRLPAGGARVALAGVRRARLCRRFPAPEPEAGPVHLVVEPGAGLEEERRLAHRLPDRHAGHSGQGREGVDLQDAPLLRSCAFDDRL